MTKIYALHGFLGLPSDWNLLRGKIEGSIEALKTFSFSSPQNGLYAWGKAFNHWVKQQPAQRRILIGYSQGGRLAMHALLDSPQLWDGAILISAHTGLKSLEEKKTRLQSDMLWAQKFLNEPWAQLIHDWNHQAAFQGQNLSFYRKEDDFVRSELALGLEGWSVGKQDDLQEPLSKLPFPILWIAGEKDFKYVEIAKQMASLNPHFSFWVAKDAGHRAPWECPALFLEQIRAWL